MAAVPDILISSSLRWLRTHPWQFLLSILGVAVGVSVVVAIDLANTSAERAFVLSSETVAGRATHVVVGGASGVPDSVYAQLVRSGLPLTAAPVVETWVRVADRPELGFRVLGVDPLAEVPFRPFTGTQRDGGLDLARFVGGQGGVLLSAPDASALDVASGDSLTFLLDGVERRVVVQGIAQASEANPVTDLVIADISLVKSWMNDSGVLSRVDLILDDADGDAVEALLPDGIRLERSSARTETLAQMTDAFSLNLTALSLLALIVGMFLTYNTMSFSVVQRYVLIGRLRAVGVRRVEIVRMILAEAVLVGLAGTTLGLMLGVVLGQGLVQLVTRTINDLYFVVSVRELHVGTWTLVKGIGLGMGATILAAWVPGRTAASTPASTLMRRSSEEDRMAGRLSRLAGTGTGLLVVGTAVLFISAGGIALAYGGIFMLILGWALVSPPLTAGAVRLLRPVASRLGGVIGRMAVGSIRSNLSRTSVAIAALSIAIASVIGVGVMVGSFRTTVVTWLEGALQADIYIQPPNMVFRSGGAQIQDDVVTLLRGTEGVASAHAIRHTEVMTDVGRVHVAAIETGPHSRGALALKDGQPEQILDRFERELTLLVSEPFAYRYGTQTGDSLRLETPTGPLVLPVIAVYHDYASDQGTIMIHRRLYADAFGDDDISGLAVFVGPDVTVDGVVARMKERTGARQQLIIQSNRDLRAYSLDVFDRTFTVTRVLQLLAVIVAFIGILSALMALQLERAKEMAVLRANGMTGGQLSRFVAWQCGIMGLISGVLAIPLGGALALALIYVINLRSFGWTLRLETDPMLVIQGVIVAVVAALLAGWLPARHMKRLEPAQALRSEG